MKQHISYLRDVIRRYKWVITMLGGMLVFVTFINNDIKRDDLKEYLDTVSAAETNFTIRRQVTSLAMKPRTIVEGPNDFDLIGSQNDMISSWLSDLDMDIQNLNDLIRTQPAYFSAQAVELTSIKERKAHLEKSCDRRSDDIFFARSGDRQEQRTAFLTIPKEVGAGFDLTAKLARRVYSLEDNSLNRARQLEKERKEAYEKYKKRSILLFALGWGFGLLGQLLGAEESSK